MKSEEAKRRNAEYMRRYRARMTPEERQHKREIDAEWRKNNPEKANAHQQKWRAPYDTAFEVKYKPLHKRVYRARGKASEHVCACGAPAREWANLTGKYDDVNDYQAMCIACHKAYDKREQ